MSAADPSPRRRALADIARLASEHDLSLHEIEAALSGERPTREADEAEGGGRAGVLIRVLSYLGGTFVFAGLAAFVGIHWAELNSAARIVITLGPGLAAFLLALAARGREDYGRAMPPLFLIAAALEPTGMTVAFGEFSTGGDWRHAGLVTAGAMALQFGLVHLALNRTVLWFLATVFGLIFEAIALDLIPGLPEEIVGLTVAATALLLAAHADRGAHAAAAPFWYFVGSAGLQISLFALVEDTAAELVFPAAAAGLLYLSVLLRSRGMLLTSVLGLLLFVGYYTAEHFAQSVGWPLALVAFGLLLIALGGLGLRLDRRYMR